MDYIDRTGMPVRTEEITHAIKVVAKALLSPTSVPPELFVELLTIKSALKELQYIRNKIEEKNAES